MTEATAATTLEPYLPRLTAAWARERPYERVRELDATLVSVDLSGFTALSERLAAKGRAGSEELILVISGVFEGLIGITLRHGGDVLKFRGDALLLLFEGDGHAKRACRASVDMQWFIEHAGSTMSSVGPVSLRMSTGVHTGTVHAFLVEATHRELMVTGPADDKVVADTIAVEGLVTLLNSKVQPALVPNVNVSGVTCALVL